MRESRPNIFEFAKRELSQDAMICWLFSCLKSDKEIYQNIGLDFVRFLFDNKSLSMEDVNIHKGTPVSQYCRMDVYLVIRIKNEVHPIIFEDKTDTFLHGDQMKKYIEKVNSWKKKKFLKQLAQEFNNTSIQWGKTYYFYYKTGYISSYEEREFLNQKQVVLNSNENTVIKEIVTDNMCQFLLNQLGKDDLINDYYCCLDQKLKKQQFGKENYFSDDYKKREEALGQKSGQICFMYELFGEGVELNRNDYQNWTQKNVFFDLNGTRYFFSLKWQTGQYMLLFRQWDNNKDIFQEKINNYNYALNLCKELVKNYSQPIELLFENSIDLDIKYYNEKTVFAITLNNNSKQNIISFISYFLNKFAKDNNYKKVEDYDISK